MRTKIEINRTDGLVGLELLAVVAILVLAVSIALPLFLSNKPSDRFDITQQRMDAVKNAIVGDRQALTERARTSFGFVGDLGVLPVDLTELISNTRNRPLYSVSNNVWFGWRGPYVTADTTQNSALAGGIVYTVLYDAWGHPISYTTDPQQFPSGAPAEALAMLRSAGPGGSFDPLDAISDDMISYITENEVRTFVSGYFRDRKGNPVEEGDVTIYFPNGSPVLDSVRITPSQATPGQYNSETDTVSDLNKRKFPVGSRFLITQKSNLPQLSVLNGGPMARVDFISPEQIQPIGDIMELTFRPTDNTDYKNEFPVVSVADGDSFSPINKDEEDADEGYISFVYGNNPAPLNTAVVKFGSPDWDNYRIEANILHGDGYKYQLFYRMSSLSYNPSEPNEALKISGNGYGLEFDPDSESGDDYASGEGSGIGSVTIRIWRYINGAPRELVISRTFDKDAFQSRFGYPILWRAHQLSITIQNDVSNNILHYILINGVRVFNNDISESPSTIPATGYGGILVERNTEFRLYHLLVHKVPPQTEFPFVWWSFEEGVYTENNHVYGFGYRNGAPVITGTIGNPGTVQKGWYEKNIHGQALSFAGVNGNQVNFGDIFDFRPSGNSSNFTISTWVRISSVPAEGSPYTVLCKRRLTVNNKNQNINGWRLLIERNGDHAWAGFSINRRESSQGNGPGHSHQSWELHVIEDRTNLRVGEWYHVAVTYDGSGLNGNTAVPWNRLKVYVTPYDDAAVSANPSNLPVENSLRANTNLQNNGNFLIGTQEDGQYPFRGYLDELKVFLRTLQPDEINDLFIQR